MKYLLFSGVIYYPSGGAYDFIDLFDTLEEAQAVKLKLDQDWAHIATLSGNEFKIVCFRNHRTGEWITPEDLLPKPKTRKKKVK